MPIASNQSITEGKDYYKIFEEGDYEHLSPEDMKWLDENTKEVTNNQMEEVMSDIDAQAIDEVLGTKPDDWSDKDGEWKEATNSEFEDWDWDDPKNKVLIGLYTEMKTGVGANNSNVYIIEMKDESGRTVNVWGSTVLNTKFEKVQVGEEVRIEYMGEVENKKGGRTYRDFKLFHRIPVAKEA
jgi:hypothetical protein